MSKDLLPPNATQLEKDVLEAVDFSNELEGRVDLIPEAKYSIIPTSYIPWLMVEYVVGNLSRWIPDERNLLTKGIQWHRVKGTKKSVLLALDWIGFTPAAIDEGVHGHFANVEIDVGGIPSGELIENIVNLGRLSIPLRSRLIRLYHGVNTPPFQLNITKLNEAILSNFSGLWDEDNQVWLSFRFEESDDVTSILNLDVGERTTIDFEEEVPICRQETILNEHGVCSFVTVGEGSFILDGFEFLRPPQVWTEVIAPDRLVGEIDIIVGSDN